MKTLSQITVYCFLLAFLTGCCTNSRNVAVIISNDFWNKTVYVDVATLGKDAVDKYSTCSKKEYWSTDSKLRNQLHNTSLMFNVNLPLRQVVSENDSFWENSKNDNCLALFADIPGNTVSWRIFLPLEYYSWFNFWDNRDVYVYIDKAGVYLLDKDIVIPDKATIPQKNIRKYITDIP